MKQSEIKLLILMKKLIIQGKCRFVNRKDNNYLKTLYDLDITVEEAWKHILSLNKNFYFLDNKPIFL